MAEKNTGAALANIALTDKQYKAQVVKTLGLVETYYKALASKWDEDISNSIAGSLQSEVEKTDTVVKALDDIKLNTLNILNVLKTDILSELVKITNNTKQMDPVQKWLESIRGSQKKMVENSDKEKNVVTEAVGLMAMPGEIVKSMGEVVAEKTGEAIKTGQKEVAKEQKTQSFAAMLTKPKTEPEKVSKFAIARERAAATGDRTKAILGGIGKLLKALLNPIALVAAFISRFLPYILIFGAMLYGAWQGMGEELQAKFTKLIKWISGIAATIFIAWKIVPTIIHGMAIVYHLLRIKYLREEHTAKMTGTQTEMVRNTIEHEAKMTAVLRSIALDIAVFVKRILGAVLDIVYRVVEFVRRIIAAVLDMVLRGIEFAFKMTSIGLEVIMIVALVAMLIVGIGIIFSFCTKGIGETIGKLAEIGTKSLDEILHMFLDFAKMAVEGIGALCMKVVKLFLKGWHSEDDEKEKEKPELQTPPGDKPLTNNEFSAKIAEITTPLSAISEVLDKMKPTLDSIKTAVENISTMGKNNIVQLMLGGMVNKINNEMSYEANDSSETTLSRTEVSMANTEVSVGKIESYLKNIKENVIIIAGNQTSLRNGNILKAPVLGG